MKSKKISLFITMCAAMSAFSLSGCSAVAEWMNQTFPNNTIFTEGGLVDKITGGNSGGSTNTTGTSGSGTTGVQDDGTYYSTITSAMSGQTLVTALKNIISKNVAQSYNWSRYEQADEDPDNKSNVITIYARSSLKKTAHVSNNKGWNREHAYPQSKMTSPATEDNHIIFASDSVVNGKRGNKKLGVLSSGSYIVDSYGNTTPARTNSDVFDPGDTIARGIVARATMYAFIMYGYSPTENFSSISTMMSWHQAYSVSSFEQKRNDVVYKNQHNRNPFVDHPEYAAKIWG